MDINLHIDNTMDLGQTIDHFPLINAAVLNLFLLTTASRSATQVKQKDENHDLSGLQKMIHKTVASTT